MQKVNPFLNSISLFYIKYCALWVTWDSCSEVAGRRATRTETADCGWQRVSTACTSTIYEFRRGHSKECGF